MKRIISIFILGCILMSVSVTGFAQWVDDKEIGMSYALSDNWTTKRFSNGVMYTHVSNPQEYVYVQSVGAYWAYSMDVFTDQYLKNYCNTFCSEAALTNQLKQANGLTSMSVSKIAEASEYVYYNNMKYYKYEFVYVGKAEGYADSTFYQTVFITARHGRMFIIRYTRNNSSNNFGDIVNMLSSAIYDNSEIKIYINGTKIQPDSPAVINDGRTLVPIRAVAEKLGYTVSWDGNKRMVTMVSADGKNVLHFGVDSKVAYRNYTQKINLDVPAFIMAGRTYLPLRAVTEAMDANVNWDGNYKTVAITK